MLYNKLVNILYKELGHKYPRKYFSIRYISSLFKRYKIAEVATFHYCCYGDEKSCWTDVEGINYGWLFRNYKESEMPQVLFKEVKRLCKPYLKSLYKRKIFINYEKEFLKIVIPLRDLAKYDIILIFNIN